VILVETFLLALRCLMRNKLRSFLTMLGIIIGVGSVIAMVAIGEGAKARVRDAFASMGNNMIMVFPGSTSVGGVQGGAGSMPSLTWADLEAIRNEVSAVRYVSPILRSQAQIVSETANWSTGIQGVSPEYLDIRAWKVTSGTPFTSSEVDANAKVALLGTTVVEKLFGANEDPVGSTIRIRNVPFLITGVLERKGQSPNGQDYDDALLIPFSTFQSRIQSGMRGRIPGGLVVSAQSDDLTSTAERQMRALLRERHQLTGTQDDDFQIRNLAELAAAQQEGTETMTTLLAVVALISLLIGGIGIMNIMLVSVTERTREVGIRMAVGAHPWHVMLQFLVEALTLSLLGGLVGLAVGTGVAQRLSLQFGWPLVIRADIVITSLVSSALVGVVFGLYPAHKASRLNPIEALRYE